MNVLFLLLETAAYYAGIHILFNKIHPRAGHYVLNIALNASLRGLLWSISFLISGMDTIIFLCVTVCDILSLRLAFQAVRLKSILTVYMLLYAVYMIVSSILTFLISEYTDTAVLAMIGTFTGILIVSLCIIIVSIRPAILSNIQMIPRSVKRICTVSIVSSALVTELLLYINGYKNTNEWNTLIKLWIVVFIVIIGSVFPALIVNAIGRAYDNRRSRAFEQQLELQAHHYAEMAQNNFELHRFKHDYKNLLIGLRALLREGDTQGAMDLLQKGNNPLSEDPSSAFDTGHGMVDAILYEKQKKGVLTHTVITFEGVVPTERIAPTDLCVIFGNTLDNALEACEQLSGNGPHMIRVSCRTAGGFAFIRITNPVEQDIAVSHNAVKTSKQNPTDHGFGLYSLRRAVEKYHGTMQLSCADKVFTVELELDLSA